MSPVAAAPPAAENLDTETRARIEAYLNDLDTLKARFIQVSDSGNVAQGTLYMDRPGRMRIDYDPPAKVVLVADGIFLIHIDYALESVTHLPLSSTPAYFFLRDEVRLDGEVTVTAFERGAGVLRLTLVESDEPEAGALMLTFSDRPLELRQWTVIDPQGARTSVSLIGLRTGMALDPEIFNLTVPDFGAENAQ
ncbi:MAG: LolA family protein [Alphaproteobacteria bacterium]